MRLLVLLLLLYGCAPETDDMIVSDASEIQFTPTGESSFNLEQEGYTDDYCFHQKFLCTSQRRFQGYDTENNDYILRGYDENDGLMMSTPFGKTLFDGVYKYDIAMTPSDNALAYEIDVQEFTNSGTGEDWVANSGGNPEVELDVFLGAPANSKFGIVPLSVTAGAPLSIPYKFIVSNNMGSAFEIAGSYWLLDADLNAIPGTQQSISPQTAEGTYTGIYTATPNVDAYYLRWRYTADRPGTDGGAITVTVENNGIGTVPLSMCGKKVKFKIFKASYALDVQFLESLAPATNQGAQTQAWSWLAGQAVATLPNNFTTTKRLQIPFNSVNGESYNFKVLFDLLDGGNGAGATTRMILYLTDGVSFANNVTLDNIDLGSGQEFTVPITATNDWPYLEIVFVAQTSNSWARQIRLDYVQGTDSGGVELEEEWYSDFVEFVSSWVNSPGSGRVDIQYRSIQNFADLLYDESSPYFQIQIEGRFRKERKITTQKSLELTEMVLNTASSVKKQRLLVIDDMPDYMHTKLNLILAHAASGSVLINGKEWSVEENYEEGERPESYPMSPAQIWLTEKTYYKHNVT